MSLRIKVFSLHLAASALLLSIFTCVVILLWYTPWSLLSLQGGIKILALMMLIDVVLGPSLTLLIFKPEKSRSMLVFDMSVIISMQIAAFCYGAWLLYSERPLFLALVVDRFEVVRAPDINVDAVDNSVAMPAHSNGPNWVRVDVPDALKFQQLLNRQLKFSGMELKPIYYRTLQSANFNVLAKYALPEQAINANEQVLNWLQAHELTAKKTLIFPVNGRVKQGFAVLEAGRGVPLGLIVE